MIKRLATIVAATTVALGLAAPAAYADAPVRTCRFVAYTTGTGFGDVTYSAFATGFVAHDNDDTLSISCYIKVNGTAFPGAATTTGTGTDVAVTAGVFTFDASLFDYVEICTLANTQHGVIDECFETTSAEEPPQAFFDAICLVTGGIIGANGGINILNQLVIDTSGNVFVLGIKLVDCQAFSTAVAVVRFG